MAVATESKKSKRRKPMAKKKGSSSWTFIPVIVGILLTPAALRAASILALSGPDALTLLYPWVQVVKSPLLKVSADMAIPVAQWIMYLQFPLYGLLMTWILRSGRALMAFTVVCLVHGLAIVSVYGLGYLQNTHIGY